jgi:hypothetical protein
MEQSLHLKFPRSHDQINIHFEESLEIPAAATVFMRGLYPCPERVKSGFQELQEELAALIEVLLPRRSKLKEWTERLPERPRDAERYLSESAKHIGEKERSRARKEAALLEQLRESLQTEVFPVATTAFGSYSIPERMVKIYLKPLGKLAELLQINPETLRQAIRVYFLVILLIIAGLDLDGETYSREEEAEETLRLLGSVYTLRYLQSQPTELKQSFDEWLAACGVQHIPAALLADRGAEKLRAAMIFWRRNQKLSWEESWRLVSQLDQGEPYGGGLRFDLLR